MKQQNMVGYIFLRQSEILVKNFQDIHLKRQAIKGIV